MKTRLLLVALGLASILDAGAGAQPRGEALPCGRANSEPPVLAPLAPPANPLRTLPPRSKPGGGESLPCRPTNRPAAKAVASSQTSANGERPSPPNNSAPTVSVARTSASGEAPGPAAPASTLKRAAASPSPLPQAATQQSSGTETLSTAMPVKKPETESAPALAAPASVKPSPPPAPPARETSSQAAARPAPPAPKLPEISIKAAASPTVLAQPATAQAAPARSPAPPSPPAPPANVDPTTSHPTTLPAPPPIPRAAVTNETLTYEGAPLLALAKNPRIPAKLALVREAYARAELNAAPARPRGELLLVGPPLPQSDSSGSTFRNDYVLSPVRLEVRQLVWDGGRILATVESFKESARQNASLAEEEWNELLLEVRQAYLEVLSLRGGVRLAQEQLELAQQQQRQAEARFRVGQAPRGDVLSAALPVAQAELGVTKAQADLIKAVQTLNGLLGLPPDTQLTLAEPQLPTGPLPDLQACRDEASLKRPSLDAVRHGLRAAVKSVEASELENHPNLNILLGLAAVSVGNQPIGGMTYRGGFEFAWPFLDGNKTKYMTEMARARLESAAALVQAELQKVLLEVDDAYRSLQLAVESHQTQQQRVAKARDALRIAQAQYRAGMVTLYPVRQAQTDLYEARQSELRAYFDYFLALAQLDYACGRVSVPLNVPKPEEE